MSMRKFCPKCGRKTDELVDGFCDSCRPGEVRKPAGKPTAVIMCPHCGRVRIRRKWVSGGRAASALKKAVKVSRETCLECSKMRGGYFEATIQLRGKKAEAMQRWVLKKMEGLTGKSEGAFVTSTEKVKEGSDIKLGSKQLAVKLLKELSKLYRVETRRSYKLYGEKKGRRLYRTTLLARSVD